MAERLWTCVLPPGHSGPCQPSRPTVEELERLLHSDDATPTHIHRDGSVSCGTRSTIFFDQAGPLVQYVGGMLVIEDLNPQVMTTPFH